MTRKAQSDKPVFILAMVFIALFLFAIAYGVQTYTSDYVKEQTVDLRTERIANAAFVLNSVPKGHIEIEMSGFSYKYENGEIFVKYQDEEGSVPLENLDVTEVNGQNEYTEVESVLCLSKESSVLDIKSEPC
jgi:hypothetical protein